VKSKKFDEQQMRAALQLARRGCGATSPNPMVGAILVKGGKIIGRGWHRRAGLPHAEIEALRDAQKCGQNPKGATLYVTLEPCCTHGRTPPCTEAIIASGIKRVVIGAMDPNPKHAGKGFKILRRAGIEVVRGILTDECVRLNEAFNHWIVHRTPFVTVKAAMTLDGKIATASGESKWITGTQSRAAGMKLRHGADAILVGINTVLADNPSLTFRAGKNERRLRRIILDSMARTPLNAKVVSDEFANLTTIFVGKAAPKNRVSKLAEKANVIAAPGAKINLPWLLKKLGEENVTSLLVEGGGETNASFLTGGVAQRVAFFYAPKILGGRDSRKAVAGDGVKKLSDVIQLREVEWKRIGEDLLLTALVARKGTK
jgi:diaminohydroxyphosphoribosylaminopyrimidine deaminase / 5-amino-6-(5-phosphoribosylamino)uracil reductase